MIKIIKQGDYRWLRLFGKVVAMWGKYPVTPPGFIITTGYEINQWSMTIGFWGRKHWVGDKYTRKWTPLYYYYGRCNTNYDLHSSVWNNR